MARNWNDVAEDVNFMLDHGEGIEEAAARVGYGNSSSLIRQLRMGGQGETADRVSAIRQQRAFTSGNEEWRRLSRRIDAWFVDHGVTM